MENEEVNESVTSEYVQELIKPENIVGEFTNTKEMIKTLLEED